MSDDEPPIPREKLSRTPSWIMLGFVLGCATWASVHDKFFQPEKPAAQPTEKTLAAVPTPTPAPKKPYLSMEEIEGVFFQYSTKAIWENDITEVAFWNPVAGSYSELMEVMRSGGNYYFRPITKLSRPITDYDVDESWPIRFTEPERLREKRMEPIPPIFRPAPPKLNP